MDELLLGEVSHSICNLAGELEQEGGEVGMLRRAEGGREEGGRDKVSWYVLQNFRSWCSTYSTVRR